MRSRRIRRTIGVSIGLLAFVLIAACGPAAAPPPSSPAANDSVARHNYARSTRGLGPFTVDGGMVANAQLHADRLAAGGAGCSNLWHSSELAAWYSGHAAAENVVCVAGCPADAQKAFSMWLNSSSHATNMFNPAYAFIGVATACNGSIQMTVAQYRSP